MDDITNTAETEGLFSKRSSSNILSDPRILEHLRIVAEEAQSSEKNDEDAETELVVNKRELAEKIANYNKRNQGAFRLVLKENLNFEGALRFYFEDDNEKITKAIRLTNKSLVSEILPTLIEKFKPDLDQPSLLRKAKLYEVHDEDDREADEICLDPSDYPLDIALSARRFPRFVLRLEYDKPSKPISPQQNGVAKQEEPRKSSLNSSVASLKSAASDGSSTSGSTQISKDSHHSTPVSSRFSPSKDSTSSGTPTSSRRHPDDRPSSSNSSDRAKNLFKNTHSPRSALGMFFDGVSSGNQDRSAHHAHKAVRVKHQRKRSFGSLLKLKKSVAAKKTVELSTNQLAPGVLKVFGGHVSPGSNYKSVRASEFSSAEVIVKEALERYSLDSSNSNDYVLCDVIGFFSGADGNTKRESQKTRSLEIGKWISEYSRVVGDQEKPLVLQQLWKPISGFSRRFELRKKVETEESSFFRPRGSVAVMKAASEREVQISPAIKETQSPKRIVNSFSHFESFGTDEGTNSSRPSVILSPFLPPTDTPYLLLLRGYAIAEDHLYHRLDEQIALIGLHSSISGDGNHGDYDENHPDISLFAPDVLPQHCVLCKKVEADGDFDLEEECDVNFVVYLNPNKNATVRINGVPILSPIKLSPGDLISLGVHYVYMFKDPTQVLDNTLQLNWMSTLQKFNEISENVKRNVSETDTINSETSLETTQEYFDGEDKRKLSLIYRVENEDRLVDMVMNMTQDVYELTPSYLLIMCIEHSCQYHTDVQTRGLMVKISNAIQRVALERTTEMSNIIEKHTPPDKAMAELLPQLNPVIFWMANSMEMFHFLRSNISCYVGDALLVGSHGDQSLTNADKELLVCLEEVVMYTFQQTVYHLTKVLYVALPVILDTNPFLFDEDGSNDKQPQEIEMVVNIFNQTYDALLQYSVHNEIVHQLFAYLFFFTNASLFNTLMERGAGGKFYRWAKGAQIRGNLDALEGWASKFELQDEYVHYMTRLSTAADLLATPKVQLLQADWMTIRRDFPALNAAQLQQILSEYQLGPGKSRPRGWFPPPEEVEPALRTADILLSFADYPPLSLPTANFKLDLKNGPSSTLFYDYLDFIKGSSRSGFKNSNWKTYKSSNKEKRHAPEVSSVIEPEEKLRFSAVGSPEDLDEIDAPSDKVSPSTARPQDNERNKHVSHPAAQTDQGHPEKSKGVAVKSHATGSNWREKNTPKHETRKEIPGPLPASASRTPNRNCPDTVLETSHPSGPSWPKSPQSNPRGNIKEDPSEKTHNPRARRRPSPSTTPGAIPPRGRTSGGTTPTESPRDSLRAYHVRSSSGGSSASSLSSFGTRDENQNVPKLTRKESDSYKDDETKWVEINGSEMIESVDGLSVLPENEHAYSDTETSKSKEKHNQVLLSEKVKFMGQLKRNDFHKSDLSGDVETGSGSHRKLEGMRDGNDPQDDVFIVELEKTSSGIGLGLIDGLYTPLRSPGIYVRTLLQGGAAEKDGRLRLGDRILAVNGTSLVGADYQSAMQEIREAGNNLSFLVAKSDIHIAMKITASSC